MQNKTLFTTKDSEKIITIDATVWMTKQPQRWDTIWLGSMGVISGQVGVCSPMTLAPGSQCNPACP